MGRYEVYLHTNKINGKVYVGVTKHNMMHRWKKHLRKAKIQKELGLNNYFYNAINKYGADNWDHALLEVVEGAEQDAFNAEDKWIDHYESYNPEKGYNSKRKGPNGKFEHSEATRAKISAKVSAISQDPERRAKQSQIMKEWLANNPNPFLGKNHTEETKEKLRQATKTYYKDHPNPFAGKTHTEETKTKMKEASRKRVSDPSWVSPGKFKSRETIEKIAAAKRGKIYSKFTKEMILEAAQFPECKNKNDIGEKLGCTGANIGIMIEKYGIANEIEKILYEKGNQRFKPKPTKEQLEECYNRLKSISKIMDELGFGRYLLLKLMDNYGLQVNRREYTFNHNILTESDNMFFYIFGYCTARSTIANRGKAKVFKIRSNPKFLPGFHNFLQILESTHKIHKYKDNTSEVKFENNDFCDQLLKLGIRKEGNKAIRQFPHKYSNNPEFIHFIRGYIDAQGSYTKTPDGYLLRVLGEREFLTGLTQIFKKITEINLVNISNMMKWEEYLIPFEQWDEFVRKLYGNHQIFQFCQ